MAKWIPSTGRSSRSTTPLPRRVLRASALRLDVDSRNEARIIRNLRQPWQLDSMVYADSIPRLRFGNNFLANCSARMRIYPAALPEGGETDVPISLEAAGAPPEWIESCNQAMRDLGNGRLAMGQLLHALSRNLSSPGECYLFGEDQTDGSQTWSIRSINEIVVFNDTIKLREGPVNTQGNLGLVALDPATTFVSRIWQPHPFWRMYADSPMRALANTCENILIMDRGIRAIGRSRIASAGLLLMPQGVSLQTFNNDSQDPRDGDFFSNFADMMMTPITNEGDAAAVVPGIIEGNGDDLDKIRRIDFFSLFDEHAADVRKELNDTLAVGLDIPNSIFDSQLDANHWSLWAVSDDTYRQFVEPHVIVIVDALSASFLRPYLSGILNLPAGMMEEWLPRTVLWYDPTELVTPPDRSQSAATAHAALVLSDASYREVLGFTDDDAPTPAEIEVRMIRTTRNWPPNALMALLHELDPNLTIPPMTGPPAIPGVHPGGVDIPALATPAGSPSIVPTSTSVPDAKPVVSPAKGPPAPGTPPKPITAAMLEGADEPEVQATIRALRFTLETQGFKVVDARLAGADLPVADSKPDNGDLDPSQADLDPSDNAPEQQTGVMVAFFLPGGIAKKIALDGGEPPEELHLTLAFLGEAADLTDPDGLKSAVKTWAAATVPIDGELAGVGMFTAGPEPVTYVSFDSPELPAARQALVEALKDQPVATAHGYTPHITLDYADRVSEPKVGGESVTFDTVSVVIAGDRTDYPMKPVLTAATRRRLAQHGIRVKPSAKSLRLSRKLSMIDRDFRTKLTVATNAAMLRVLEKAGAQVRSKVVGNDKALRAKTAHTRAEYVASVIGKEAGEAKGLTAAGLVTTDWSDLKASFDSWSKLAQQRALSPPSNSPTAQIRPTLTRAQSRRSPTVAQRRGNCCRRVSILSPKGSSTHRNSRSWRWRRPP